MRAVNPQSAIRTPQSTPQLLTTRRMENSRRDFLRTVSAAAVAAACAPGGALPETAPAPAMPEPSPANVPGDAGIRELAMEALNATRDAGASYADARVGRYRRQFVAT